MSTKEKWWYTGLAVLIILIAALLAFKKAWPALVIHTVLWVVLIWIPTKNMLR